MSKPGPRPQRTPGRPAKTRGDPRARLLDVAIALFSRHGIAGTPLSAIARRARVTPAMLHYYFGNRDRLLDALIEERIAPLALRITGVLHESHDDPAAFAKAFVRAIVELLAENPWLPQLWIREVLIEGGALRERLMQRVAFQVAPRLAAVFGEAKRNGRLNPGLDPRLVVVSLIGLTIFPLAAQPIWRRIFDADDIDADALIAHVQALLDAGLQPIPKETAA
jgi:TetR/AcrR family transcriptional regulator